MIVGGRADTEARLSLFRGSVPLAENLHRSCRFRGGLPDALGEPLVRQFRIVTDQPPHLKKGWAVAATTLIGEGLGGETDALRFLLFCIVNLHMRLRYAAVMQRDEGRKGEG